MAYFYYIYETKNNLTEKFYIGSHKSTHLEFDGYFGSGKLLKKSIEEYGISNFSRKILKVILETDNRLSLEEWHTLVLPIETEYILNAIKEGKILYNINKASAFGGNTTGETKWCHSKITGEQKMLFPNQTLPTGWVYGRKYFNNISTKGQKLYTNLITLEEKTFFSNPDINLWNLGSIRDKSGSKNPAFGKKWYMNIDNKQYCYSRINPEGFIPGHPGWETEDFKNNLWTKIIIQ